MKKSLTFAFACTLLTTATFAHEGATGIVKERMDAMSAIGKNMKAIAKMISGQTEFDANTIHKSAKAIADHTSQFTNMFPEGSTEHPSEAAPAIWEKPEDFSAEAKELIDYANNLASLAHNGNSAELKAAFANVGTTCKSCHQNFRIKK